MKRLLALALAAGLVGAILASPPSALAADDKDLPAPADPNAIVMNFENVELTAFIKFISKVTGRNIVFGDKIEGTVSVVSPTPVDAEQAFAMFQSVLATQGLTTVDEGAVMRIVPIKDARTSGSSVVEGGRPDAGFATRLVPLRYVNAADIARVLTPLVSKDGSIVPYEGTNTVILSETSSNLARLADMIAVMDIPGHEQTIAVIPLRYADAERTAEQVVEILLGPASGSGRRRGGGGSGSGSGGDEKDKGSSSSSSPGSSQQLGFKITPDERTNSLVVMAPSVEMARIRNLVKGLDTELRPGEERVHVYYARNADAESMVEVVSAMILGSKARTRRDRGDAKEQPASSQSMASPATPPAASNENVSITADPATNSVIVDGSASEWKTVLGLLEKLDIPRPQVFIECIIVEASANRAKALGFDYQAAIDMGAGDMLLRSNIAQLSSAFVNPLALAGLVAGAASDKQIELPDGTEIPANYVLLQAIDQTNDIEVLSAPTMLTLDNQEAEIIVGQNIPFITGRTTDITNVNNIFTQVERRDVGIKMRVRPQVAEGDLVVLEVQQEVSAVVRAGLTEAQLLQLGPVTTVRSASTTVSVADGRTVVIGGLMSNRLEDGEQKVPLLGDIPWLGRLFTYKRRDGDKVNLIVFLTPHVIRSPRDLSTVSTDRRERFRAGMYRPATPLPGEAPPPPSPDPKAKPVRGIAGTNPEVYGVEEPVPGAEPAPGTVQPAPRAVQPEAPPPGDSGDAAPPSGSAAPRHESTYRHSTTDRNNRIYPLNRDTRERAPF